MRKVCDFALKFSIYGLVLLMPLFWLPWTSGGYEFNKHYLLVFFTGLALLAWLVKMIVARKRVSFRRTPLDIWILALAAVMILSAVFSIDSISSWLGFYGRFSDSLIVFLSVLALYFVLVNNTKINSGEKSELGEEISGKKQESLIQLSSVLRLFVISSYLVVIFSLLGFYGVLAKVGWLPALVKNSFLVSASAQGLAVYLVALVAFLAGSLMSACRKKKASRVSLTGEGQLRRVGFWAGAGLWIQSILLALSVYLLIALNFWSAWMMLGITMLILLVMAFWTRLFKERVNLLMLPIALLLISCFFVFNFPGKGAVLNNLALLSRNAPQELGISYDLNRSISWQAIKEYPTLGSGPGTFLYNFAEFKPVEFNQGQFWNVRFDRGASHILELAGTVGILGLLSYLLVIFVFLLIMSLSLQRLRKVSQESSLEERNKKDKAVLILPLFLAWVALAAGQFFSSQNTVLLFFFWLFAALAVISWQAMENKKVKKFVFSFKKMPEVGLLINVALLILIFILVGFFYLAGQFYAAEIKFNQPVKDNQEWVRKMESVVNLNPYREVYRRGLSQAYLTTAWQEANKKESERDFQLLQNLTAGAVQQARTAIDLSPNSVLAWENLAAIYRDSWGLIGGVIPFALDTYAQASELEPANPLFYRERCRLNLLDENRDWEQTVQLCQKAVELKKNYLDAQIQLALVFEQKGELESAVKEMEGVLSNLRGVSFQRGSELAGAATEIYFQLGRLYFNLKDYSKAIKMFEQSVIISPNYANARYALGLSYQSVDRQEEALTQYKIISQLLPNNQEIKDLIRQLEQPQQPQEELEQIEQLQE